MNTTTTIQPRCRLLVIGAGIRALITGDLGFGNYAEIVGDYPDLASWLGDESPKDADVVIANCPSLFPDVVDEIRVAVTRCKASRAVLVYDFTQAGLAESLSEPAQNITALRAPVTVSELRQACEADVALATLRDYQIDLAPAEKDALGENEIPARQFSDAQLAEISQISTTIDCECPHHLSALLVSLNAFEKYSRDCENRNDQDAFLHAYLHRSTAKARAMIEEALVVLAEAEGIDI